MGRRRSGNSLHAAMFAAHQAQVEETKKRRAIQDAATPEDRERIEASQQGREAFANKARWGHLDMHGNPISPPAETTTTTKKVTDTTTPAEQLKIEETKKKKKTTKSEPSKLSSAVAGSLGSTSGGSVNL